MLLSVTSFSLLAPLLVMLLGAGQVGVWYLWRQHQALLWLGVAFLAISLGVFVQLLWQPSSLTAFVLAFSVCYLAGFSAVGLALARRMHVRFAWRAALVISLMCLGLQVWFSAMTPDLPMRVTTLNVAVMALAGLPLLHWRKMHRRNHFDEGLRWLYVSFIVLNALRVLVTLPLSSVEHVFDFTQTWFWLSVHVLLMGLGMSAASCMLLAVLHDVLAQLHTERNTDVLTLLPNRRGWQARLEQLQTLHSRQLAQPCALLLVDVDHFKQINDRFGHAVGDLVLQEVANTMRRQLRGNDVVCRYGGEEFAVLLLGANLAAAKQAAERMRQHIQDMQLPFLNGAGVTVSIGVSIFKWDAAYSVQKALEAADAQMYAAKRAGRNQVVMAS